MFGQLGGYVAYGYRNYQNIALQVDIVPYETETHLNFSFIEWPYSTADVYCY